MRITQIITILLSGALLALAGWLAVAPPEPHLAVQAQFEEVAAPTTPEPGITEPVKPPTTEVAPPKPLTGPAAFTVSDFGMIPEEPVPNQDLEVLVTVTNTGAEQGTYKAVFRVEATDIPNFKVITQEKTVTLAGGKSERVSFKFTMGPLGNYKISVGELSEKVYVETPEGF